MHKLMILFFQVSEKYVFMKDQFQKQQQTTDYDSIVKEMNTYQIENDNLLMEVKVLRDLNDKLEERNLQIENEKDTLREQVDQMQSDVKIMKVAFEDLLAKELHRQRAEFKQKENFLQDQLITKDEMLREQHNLSKEKDSNDNDIVCENVANYTDNSLDDLSDNEETVI